MERSIPCCPLTSKYTDLFVLNLFSLVNCAGSVHISLNDNYLNKIIIIFFYFQTRRIQMRFHFFTGESNAMIRELVYGLNDRFVSYKHSFCFSRH